VGVVHTYRLHTGRIGVNAVDNETQLVTRSRRTGRSLMG
jgi:hypothetical protein